MAKFGVLLCLCRFLPKQVLALKETRMVPIILRSIYKRMFATPECYSRNPFLYSSLVFWDFHRLFVRILYVKHETVTATTNGNRG